MAISKQDRSSSNAFLLMAVSALGCNFALAYWISNFEKEFLRELIGPLILHGIISWFIIRVGMSALTEVDDARYSDYCDVISRASFSVGLLLGAGVSFILYTRIWGLTGAVAPVVLAALIFYYGKITNSYIDWVDGLDKTQPAIPKDR